MNTKFKLYNFAGKPVSYWTAAEEKLNLATATTKNEPKVSHHIRIIDASGSMCCDLEALKQQLEKEMTLDEYKRSDLHVSLISYASDGDCKLHFEHAPITEIMKANSSMIKVLRSISTRGCTGISQSLRMALGLVRKGELTGISLHSDGYANDPSPSREYAAIDAICKELATANVFVNTVAYRESSDFKFLSKIANAVSGKCVLARSVKEVYDAIYDTSTVLNKAAVPVTIYEPKGADFVVLVSPTANRINGSSGDLKVTGLTQTDTGSVYRFKKVTEAEYGKSSATESQDNVATFAFSAANLAAGNLNTAKFAMASAYDLTLVERHAKALTNAQIAEMASDLQDAIFKDRTPEHKMSSGPINLSGTTSVLKVLQTLDANREELEIDIEHLQSVYKRRGLKRVNGTRDANGNLVAPAFGTKLTSESKWVPLGSFDINRNAASVNLTIARPCKLIKVADGAEITAVCGVKVDKLSTFNAYTIVGDGELNVPEIKIRCKDFAANRFSKCSFDDAAIGTPELRCGAESVIDLSKLPIMDYGFDKDISGIGAAFDQIVQAQILSKILSAAGKEESSDLTKEQVEALKIHCLSKNLNLNFPTTTEYTDLQKALADGTVDIRTSYRVDVGNNKLLGTSGLPSANAFLDRMYEQVEKGSGKVADKATFKSFFDRGVTYRFTGLSKKSKPAATDAILQPIFDDFLGIKSNGSVNAILKAAGSPDTLASLLKDGAKGVLRAMKAIDDYVNELYLANVVPLVFFVSATGLIPDQIKTPLLSADDVQSKYPDLKLDKDSKEGSFFEIDKNVIMAVYSENAYYSTGKTAAVNTVPQQQASKTVVAPQAQAPLRKKSALAHV